jgi:hypothetical protein
VNNPSKTDTAYAIHAILPRAEATPADRLASFDGFSRADVPRNAWRYGHAIPFEISVALKD